MAGKLITMKLFISVLQEKREQAAEAAAMKKDPDAYRAKMEAMEAARMRMQEKYNQVDINKYC